MLTRAPFGPRWPLAPLAPVYGAAILARRWLYDVGWLRTHLPPCPTFCIGGLEAGGSGKTPVTAWLLRWLSAQGEVPGLLTRGYGRARPVPSLVVRHAGEAASAQRLGDEAAMLVAAGLDVPVAACARRRSGAEALAAAGCSAIVMDDGFAHRAFGRHLDVVVLRGDAPLADGRLLPWGTLREPPSSLRRASVVWLHHKHARASTPQASHPWRRWAPDATVVQSCARYVLTDTRGAPVPLPRACAAASGIADPAGFQRALASVGMAPRHHEVFADHHRYTGGDVLMLCDMMTRCAAEALVVTEKDAVKLRELWPSRQSLLVLRATMEIVSGMTHFVTLAKGVLKQ